jgi:hypothetical protein
MPLSRGIEMSRTITSGRVLAARSTSARPSPAVPTISHRGSSKRWHEAVEGNLKAIAADDHYHTKGKKLIQAQQWKSKPYRQARAERSAMESLVFTLKESFEYRFGLAKDYEASHKLSPLGCVSGAVDLNIEHLPDVSKHPVSSQH